MSYIEAEKKNEESSEASKATRTVKRKGEASRLKQFVSCVPAQSSM